MVVNLEDLRNIQRYSLVVQYFEGYNKLTCACSSINNTRAGIATYCVRVMSLNIMGWFLPRKCSGILLGRQTLLCKRQNSMNSLSVFGLEILYPGYKIKYLISLSLPHLPVSSVMTSRSNINRENSLTISSLKVT